MKTLLSLFATVLVIACVLAISVLSAFHHPVPAAYSDVALGAFAGAFALVSVPTIGALIVGVAILAAMLALSLVGISIPTTLTELLVVALTGHFALTLPADAPAVASPAPAVDSAPAPAPAPVVASHTIGGQ